MSFSADVERIARRMKVRADDLARASVLEVFLSTIESTPVDTGRLRGNWQLTTGTPASGTLDRFQKEKRDGGASFEVISKVGGPNLYYLTNNLPYAERIEFDGWSTEKAPQGMVRINARRIRAIVAKEARKL